MDAERLDIEKTLQYLTLNEKLRMLSGDGTRHTFGVGELPRVLMADGPNGLRIDAGAFAAAPSVCYPTAAMLANSWDPALLYNVGAAIGREATATGVNLLLAPGINIKRSPLCGRNFDYYSEDPYLAGTLAKAFISGVQSTGVGACVKHFAANNQESYRMYSDSIVDMRALHEIYLKPFAIALAAEPAAVMCAYNKLNGVYCSQSEYLLRTVLRDELGYKGVTVSDWGAVRDRVKSLKAGLDLEMPDPIGQFDDDLRAAISDGEITEETVDNSLRRTLELIDNVYLEPYGDYDPDMHERLCYNAAVEGIVLLRNENGCLPLTRNKRVAVMGTLAETAPIQGVGSSYVIPVKSFTPLDAFKRRDIDVKYYRGYDSGNKKENQRLYEQAMTGAAGADVCIVFAGPEPPSEGADRKTLALPPEQDRLITGLTNAGHRVVVVLVSPGAVTMPWINRVRSVVYSGLNGQAGALAAVDVLYGRVNPRGRLAETFPADESELPPDFGGLRTVYRESIFVGYRYYDAIKRRVLFPFGHGLSYSAIKYESMRVKRLGENRFDVTVRLTNSSPRDAYETVQLYVSDRTGRVLTPEKQLAAFKKVFIEGKTSVDVTLKLDKSAFEFYNVKKHAFSICDGEFRIMAGASSTNISHEASVKIAGDITEKLDYPEVYKLPLARKITDADFEALYGAPVPAETPRPVKGEFTLDSCLNDIKHTLAGKIAIGAVKRRAKALGDHGSAAYEGFMNSATLAPMSAVVSMSDGAMPPNVALGMIEMANGHPLRGIKLMLKKKKPEQP